VRDGVAGARSREITDRKLPCSRAEILSRFLGDTASIKRIDTRPNSLSGRGALIDFPYGQGNPGILW